MRKEHEGGKRKGTMRLRKPQRRKKEIQMGYGKRRELQRKERGVKLRRFVKGEYSGVKEGNILRKIWKGW